MYRGNLQNTGEYYTRAARRFADANWVFSARGPIKCTPVVHDGVVYVSSLDENLYAVETRNGTLKWMTHVEPETKYQIEVGVSPAVGGRYLWYADDKFNLHGVDKQTLDGEISMGSEHKIFHAPRVFNGVVYVGGPGYFTAIDTITSAARWVIECEAAFICAPAIAEGVVHLMAEYGVLFSIDAESGDEKARCVIDENELDGHIVHGIALKDGIMHFLVTDEEYILDEGNYFDEDELPWLQAFCLESQKTLWRVKPGCLSDAPAVDSENVYACSYDGQLIAFDRKDGKVRWIFEADSPLKSAPSIAENLIYFGTLGGTLFVVDTATGSEIARYETRDRKPIRTSPALADGVVYFGDDGGNLYSWGAPGN